MSLARSLAEVDHLAVRATRGAGYPWGLADEAGRAVRILAESGMDGCPLLARLIGMVGPLALHTLAPRRLDTRWDGNGGPLCPIRCGASLSDMARSIPADGLALNRMLVPALLLPFAFDVAHARDEPVTLSWRGGIVGIGPDGLPRAAGLNKLALEGEADLFVHPGGTALPVAAKERRAYPDATAWAALQQTAARG
jgi:hypothetical protein